MKENLDSSLLPGAATDIVMSYPAQTHMYICIPMKTNIVNENDQTCTLLLVRIFAYSNICLLLNLTSLYFGGWNVVAIGYGGVKYPG